MLSFATCRQRIDDIEQLLLRKLSVFSGLIVRRISSVFSFSVRGVISLLTMVMVYVLCTSSTSADHALSFCR